MEQFNLEVFEQDGKEYVGSKQLENVLGKKHYAIKRDIRQHVRNLKSAGIDYKKYFVDSSFLDKYGREQHCYLLTEKGVIFFGIKQKSAPGVLFTGLFSKYAEEDVKKINTINKVVELLVYSRENGKNELYFQDVFNKHHKKIIPNSKKVNIKYNSKHIPDAFLKIDNEKTPVEMKLREFDLKALNQLLRYMEVYDCKNGIAIGNELKVVLPENITFIPLDEVKKYDL